MEERQTLYSSRDGRELTPDEVRAFEQVEKFRELTKTFFGNVVELSSADPRWAAIAKTHFQEGLMALTRAITKPDTF